MKPLKMSVIEEQNKAGSPPRLLDGQKSLVEDWYYSYRLMVRYFGFNRHPLESSV